MHHSRNKKYLFFCSVAITVCLSACMTAPFYQKEEYIPQNAWSYSYKPSFTFDITDTTVSYQPYFLIRHTQAYPYCNIWVWAYVKTPGDSVVKKTRINVTLAETSGRWLGRGMGEIYEQQMAISLGDSVNFSKAGTYKVSFEQNMRVNPLPEVMNVGLRVQKAGPKTQH